MLDKFVNGAFMGKRQIGRPIKYNLRNRNTEGWLELVFAPRTRTEEVVSNVMKFMHPYLFFITYRFHVEKAREVGMRIEDVYHNKFHKEPYIMNHIYAQYFHPDTLLERVRDVAFYRRPRTIFKGFKVPDWATSTERHGWEVDNYSRQAWDNAVHDLNSEWTPTQFAGERIEPNVLSWFRLEQWGKGNSARLFYNEVPQPNWFRHGGHMLKNSEDDKERDKVLYSFSNADQDRNLIFGMDTTTPEGREAFRKEYMTLCELAPEIVKEENLIFPHEIATEISSEPHFQRVWQLFREHTFRVHFARAVEAGRISEADADAFVRFVNLNNAPSFNIYILGRTGKLDHLAHDEGYAATMRVMDTLGLNAVQFNHKSAQPVDEQFWEQYDGVYQLTVSDMRRELPNFVAEPSNRAKVEALMNGQPALEQETTVKLAA